MLTVLWFVDGLLSTEMTESDAPVARDTVNEAIAEPTLLMVALAMDVPLRVTPDTVAVQFDSDIRDIRNVTKLMKIGATKELAATSMTCGPVEAAPKLTAIPPLIITLESVYRM